jgi:N-acetylglucosamine-6-phosphate deacetylase
MTALDRPPDDAAAHVFALAAPMIFDGQRMLAEHAVIVRAPLIEAVVPVHQVGTGITIRALSGTLVPGFIDIQVNGGGGVLFNDEPNVAGIAAIAGAHRAFGTTGLLPTFISDSRERMAQAIAAAHEAVQTIPGVIGIHLEGPFLNAVWAGAHDRSFIRTMDDADLDLISSARAAGLLTLLTLAPETVPPAAIAQLRRAGVVVAAGHTGASVETIGAARDAGLTGFTHLYNAMPPLTARGPGPVGAALADRMAWVGLIVDLHHVSATAVRVAIAAHGFERTMLTTDAMPTVGTDSDGFLLQGRPVRRRHGRLTTEAGRLAGSDLDMATAVRNAVREIGLPLAEALHMASRAPAEFLGLGNVYGRIAPGYRANLVLLDADLRVTATWIDGA